MTERSYNGWSASRDPDDFGGLEQLKVGTETFPPGVRAGDVHTVLSYVATQLDARVEAVDLGHPSDDWGWNYRKNRNADNLSCHASGTAFDYNATRHPNGKRGTYTRAQVATIRTILVEVDHLVKWGGDFTGTPDEMHFEIHGTPSQIAALARRLRSTANVNVQEDDEMNDADRKYLADQIAKARTEQKNDQRELLTVLQRIEAKLAAK